MSIVGNPNFYIKAGTGVKEGTATPASGKLFSLVQQDNVYLAMDVTRAGTKVRINKQGYLETVPANTAAIDWVDGVPVINSEGQATQLLTRPISFPHSDWIKSGATIEGDASTAGVEKVVNGNFTNWTDDNPDNFTMGFTENANNYVTEDVNGMRLVSDGDLVRISQSNLDSTKLYLIQIEIHSITFGGINILGLTGKWQNVIYSEGVYSKYVIGDTGFYISRQSGVTDAIIKSISIKEVSGFAAPAVDENGDVLLDAYKLLEGTNNETHQIFTSVSGLTGSIVQQIHAKKGEKRYISFVSSDAVTYKTHFVFDLQSGEFTKQYVSSGYTAIPTVKSLTNDWYQISIVLNGTYNTTFYNRIYIENEANPATPSGNSYQGDGTSGIYIYNAQLEAGSVATSPVYIDKTLEGATRTRLADIISKTSASGLTSIIEGSLFVDFDITNNLGASQQILSVGNGTTSNRIVITKTNANDVAFVISSSSGSKVNRTNTILSNGRHKACVFYKDGLFRTFLDGQEIAFQQSFSFINQFDIIAVGTRQDNLGAESLNGSINEVILSKSAFSEAKAIELTTL